MHTNGTLLAIFESFATKWLRLFCCLFFSFFCMDYETLIQESVVSLQITPFSHIHISRHLRASQKCSQSHVFLDPAWRCLSQMLTIKMYVDSIVEKTIMFKCFCEYSKHLIFIYYFACSAHNVHIKFQN